ncbi:hypothetical protein KSS87_018902 [Heliosperma pusillum]|nr:hypothetical protein KSS87_018902 [Heliosperma pusillum]
MGSMSEGRKCVRCIDKRIDESKREKLEKCSRAGVLSRLLGALKVKQVMKVERECLVNQLRPEQLVVNGYPLKPEEMDALVGCQLPPRKLKPGEYWYDKETGFWGKVANVQCSRGTHLWVYDDGSYEEEANCKTKPKPWRKVSTRLVCALFSLPVLKGQPHGGRDEASEDSEVQSYVEKKSIPKLILLGLEGSGTSTIFKQAKFLYGNSFTAEELQDIKLTIQNNVYKYLRILLDARERFEEEDMARAMLLEGDKKSFEADGNSEVDSNLTRQSIYSINQRLKDFCNWQPDTAAAGDLDALSPSATATRNYDPLIEEVWRDPAIQETYKRKDEIHSLPDVAEYFLNQAVEVFRNEYVPSERDILYAEAPEVLTQDNGFLELSHEDHNQMSKPNAKNSDEFSSSTKYQLIRLTAEAMSNGSNCNLVEISDGVQAIVFCVALSDYDQTRIAPGSETLGNKFMQSIELFEKTISNPIFQDVPCVLLLNKNDLFKEKLSRVPWTTCEWFNDFCPIGYGITQEFLANQGYLHIVMRSEDVYTPITGKTLFVWPSNARDRKNVDEAFQYLRKVTK